jgi:tetratricopeptide (TPR) repeat protein
MKPIIYKPAHFLLLTCALSLAIFNLAIAEEEPLTDEHAQKIFDMAMDERDDGKVYDAIEKFEYILSRRPSLNRARLELAVSYHRASQYEDALREFQKVLDDPETPEKVRLAILAYLGQLTSDELKPKTENNFSYYTKAGLMYNTNINFAPLRGSTIYDIPDGEDTASPGLDTFLSASHQYRDNTPFNTDGAATLFEWQSQVSWTGNNYTRNSDYSLNILSASTGPAFISAGRWRGAISLQVDQTFFGNSVLGTFTSVNPLLTFDLGNYRGITLEASYMNNDFSRTEDQGRDGHSVLAGAAYSTLLGGVDNGIETGFRVTDLTADDAQYGYKSTEIYFGGFVGYGDHSNFYLNINLEQYDFDAADTVSGIVRDELEGRYLLGYNWDISEGSLAGWTLNTYFSFTNNNSNVDVYSYERKIVAINLARYFL